MLNRGVGKYFISKFLSEIMFSLVDSTSCLLEPEPDHIAAIKTYEKVDSKYIKTVQTEDGYEYIKRIEKDEFPPL